MNLRGFLSRLIVLAAFSCLALLLAATLPASAGTRDVKRNASGEPSLEAEYNCADNLDVPLPECEALKALYIRTNGAGWTRNANWLTTPSPCGGWVAYPTRWYGVSCQYSEEDSKMHVVGLALDNNLLSGTIPPELGNLPKLDWLALHHNELYGPIPQELANLAQLTDLYLQNNQLFGEIPPALGNLPNLVSLFLDSNNLMGPIPAELGNLSSLRWLSIAENQLSDEIPPELGKLVDLQRLDLSSNWLSGPIPSQLGSLSNLTTLRLAGNELSGSIPPQLGALPRLQTLDLNGNHLSGPIPFELGSLGDGSNLTELRLCDNELSGSIPAPLGRLSSLQTLELCDNRLRGSIPPEVGNLASLETLALDRNQLGKSIPQELGALTELRVLLLGNNQLQGLIPPDLSHLTSLRRLDLSYNALRATDPDLIAFLNTKQSAWADTQTVPPTNLQAQVQPNGDIVLSWAPITYTGDGGYYEILYGAQSGDPYQHSATTASKLSSGYVATGLPRPGAFYFVVRAFTPAHDVQQNNLWSDFGAEVKATLDPTIAMTKTPPMQIIRAGGQATFQIRVENTNDVPLRSIAVADLSSPNCSRSLATLAARETWTYTCMSGIVNESFTNRADVSAVISEQVGVEDSDTAEVVVARVVLSPRSASSDVGTRHTATATVESRTCDDSCYWQALGNQPVSFLVGGANSVSRIITTNAQGQATFTYTGTLNAALTDSITAWLDLDHDSQPSSLEPFDTVTVLWRPVTLSFVRTTDGTAVDAEHTITATVTNNLRSPVEDLPVQLRVVQGAELVTLQNKYTGRDGKAIFKYRSTAARAPAQASSRGSSGAAAMTPEVTPSDTETIEVWVDLNGNGEYDAGEPYQSQILTSAITLVSFTARIYPDGRVGLAWTTSSEIDNAGFNLYRAAHRDGPYAKINAQLIPGQGMGVHMGASYNYVESQVAGQLFYRLEDVNLSGVTTLHLPIEAQALPELPAKAYLPAILQAR